LRARRHPSHDSDEIPAGLIRHISRDDMQTNITTPDHDHLYDVIAQRMQTHTRGSDLVMVYHIVPVGWPAMERRAACADRSRT
jgi:hypothetical protein